MGVFELWEIFFIICFMIGFPSFSCYLFYLLLRNKVPLSEEPEIIEIHEKIKPLKMRLDQVFRYLQPEIEKGNF